MFLILYLLHNFYLLHSLTSTSHHQTSRYDNTVTLSHIYVINSGLKGIYIIIKPFKAWIVTLKNTCICCVCEFSPIYLDLRILSPRKVYNINVCTLVQVFSTLLGCQMTKTILTPLDLLVFKFRDDSCTLSLRGHNLWTLRSTIFF